MFFEMACSCSAMLNVDVSEDKAEAAWLLVNRFTSAHVGCGYMTPLLEEMPHTTKKFNMRITDKDF